MPSRFLNIIFASLIVSLLPQVAAAQNIVVLVNDEPITTYDVTQRQRWIARTSGFGARMKTALQSDAIKERYKELMIAANPTSREEAEADAEKIKKRLIEETKQKVMAQASSASRKDAIEALVNDRLKLQAAKKMNIIVTDDEVTKVLSSRAKGPDGKSNLEAFYAQFESDGIGRKAIMEIIRAQLAWRDVVRRTYGPRIQTLIAPIPKTNNADSNFLFEAREVKLTLPSSSDQKAIARRLVEADSLREAFRSCGELANQVKLIASSSIKVMSKAKLADFPAEAQPLVEKASDNQMTPPLLSGGNVVAYAVCRKVAVADKPAKGEAKEGDEKEESASDLRQQEFERYSKRHLQDLRQSASIDYRGS
jgi:peptidyl-prolyl cis-trans isomerase SurA